MILFFTDKTDPLVYEWVRAQTIDHLIPQRPNIKTKFCGQLMSVAAKLGNPFTMSEYVDALKSDGKKWDKGYIGKFYLRWMLQCLFQKDACDGPEPVFHKTNVDLDL